LGLPSCPAVLEIAIARVQLARGHALARVAGDTLVQVSFEVTSVRIGGGCDSRDSVGQGSRGSWRSTVVRTQHRQISDIDSQGLAAGRYDNPVRQAIGSLNVHKFEL
jgi:hypothetical protein